MKDRLRARLLVRWAATLTATLFIAACGGGGGSSSNLTPTVTTNRHRIERRIPICGPGDIWHDLR